MNTFATLGLELDWNPAAIAIVLTLAYLLWFVITREPSPLATARRRARQNTLRLGRRCALVVAVSWVITLAPPARSVARDVAESLALAALVLAGLFLVRLAGAFLAERGDRSERLRRIDAAVRAGAGTRAGAGGDAASTRPASAAPAASEKDVPTAPAAQASPAPAEAPSPVSSEHAVAAVARPRRAIDAAARMAGESDADHARRDAVMDRLEERVRTHDLGSPASAETAVEGVGDARRAESGQASDPSVNPAPRAAEAAALAPAPTGALGRRLAEVTEELATLRRVVIAQRAELDFEREAHDRSRAAARKALDIAQRAVADRRVAIKLARRERRARLQLEGRLGVDPDARRGNAASTASPMRAPTASPTAVPALAPTPAPERAERPNP